MLFRSVSQSRYYAVAASDIPFKPKIGDKIKDQYLGVDESYEIVQIKENEAGEQVASWRLVCVVS